MEFPPGTLLCILVTDIWFQVEFKSAAGKATASLASDNASLVTTTDPKLLESPHLLVRTIAAVSRAFPFTSPTTPPSCDATNLMATFGILLYSCHYTCALLVAGNCTNKTQVQPLVSEMGEFPARGADAPPMHTLHLVGCQFPKTELRAA